jgi:hypothetical protein
MKILEHLTQSLLYAPGTFFCFPWKPIINQIIGDSYSVGYFHFRRDHHGKVNLACHIACLILQVLSNFGLLNCIDLYFQSHGYYESRMFSNITAGMWVLYLLTLTRYGPTSHPIPIICTILAVISIFGGYYFAPFLNGE